MPLCKIVFLLFHEGLVALLQLSLLLRLCVALKYAPQAASTSAVSTSILLSSSSSCLSTRSILHELHSEKDGSEAQALATLLALQLD